MNFEGMYISQYYAQLSNNPRPTMVLELQRDCSTIEPTCHGGMKTAQENMATHGAK